jgi:general nucleoside transport system permease protein
MTDVTQVNDEVQKLLTRATRGRGEFEDLVVVPLFAVVVALILGALIMLATGVDLATIGKSFVALAKGSVGSLNAISETLTAAIPLVLAGLGLGLGFRAGLFNIGAEGQIVVGGLASVVFAFSFAWLPAVLLVPLSLLAGAMVGAFYAGIAGVLKAATGAHEVISTIMLNLSSYLILIYALKRPYIQVAGRSDPVSKSVPVNGELPRLFSAIDPNLRLHAGVFLMLLAVVFLWWLLFRSKVGFAFRASGANPDAARYAGMRSGMVIVSAMATAGAFAGLAGGAQVLGVLGRATPGFSAGIGFDAIAVALLGRSHPVGILFAGILFGGLEAGGRQMQVDASVSIDLIGIIQALVIVFIAAPLLVRAIFPWGFKKENKGGEA